MKPQFETFRPAGVPVQFRSKSRDMGRKPCVLRFERRDVSSWKRGRQRLRVARPMQTGSRPTLARCRITAAGVRLVRT